MKKETFERAVSLKDELDLLEHEALQLEMAKSGLLRLTLSKKARVGSLIEKFFKDVQEEVDRERFLINQEFESL